MEQSRQFKRSNPGDPKVYKIFSIIEKTGSKNIWLDIGVGRLNRDNSITGKLDCLPINGVIQIRPYDGVRGSKQITSNHSGNANGEGARQE